MKRTRSHLELALQRHLHRAAGEIHLGRREDGGEHYIPMKDFTEHAHIVGRTGSGKTRLLQHITEELIRSRECAVLVLDPHDGPPPHGGLYHALKSFCYRSGQTERLRTLDPAEQDLGYALGFDPLRQGRNPIVRACFSVDVLRTACNATAEFSQMPRFAKWAFNVLLGLDQGELTMGDARHAVDPTDPTYRRVFAEILEGTDKQTAACFRWLVELELAGKRGPLVMDEQLGSLANRILRYTANDYTRRMLLSRRCVLDPHTVLRERAIVLANLSPRDFFTRDESKMLGSQLLHTFLRAAMSRRQEEADATPLFVVADEFHFFLTPELLEILEGGRKFGIHLILAHQYLVQLQDVARDDWRYYHSVLGMPRVRVVFGGSAIDDTKKLGEEMWYSSLDPDRIKQEIYGTVQTSHVEMVRIHSHMEAESRGWNTQESSSSNEGKSDSKSYPGGDSPSAPWGPEPSVQSFASNYAAMLGSSTGQSGASTVADGYTDTPMVLPDPVKQELRNREHMTLEEQLYRYATKLHRQPPQHGVVHVKEKEPVFFKVANVPDPHHTLLGVIPLDRERLVALAGEGRVLALPVLDEEARERDAAFRRRVNPALPKEDEAEQFVAKLRATRPTPLDE